MSWYRDLSPFVDFGDERAGKLLAVGWLMPSESYPKGEMPESVFEKLCQLLQNSWNPVLPAGFHQCEFCRFTGGGISHFKNYKVSALSCVSLYVPGDGVIYVAPESVAHYIDAHNYCPPKEFCDAVMNCPEMRSVTYLKAILANGGRGLTK